MFDCQIIEAISDASASLKETVARATGHTPRDEEVVFKVFPQLWGGSALGYSGGLTLHAMTTAYTVVGFFGGLGFVYFGGRGRLAYIARPNDAFLQGVAGDHLHSQLAAPNYYELVGSSDSELNEALVFDPHVVPFPSIIWGKMF